ncbi:hypothetical protein ACSNOJ_28620 [Streptomyces sp. URMC 128]
MEIVAYGVLADEEPLLHDAFGKALGDGHEVGQVTVAKDVTIRPTPA